MSSLEGILAVYIYICDLVVSSTIGKFPPFLWGVILCHLVRHVASLQVEAGSPWGKRSVYSRGFHVIFLLNEQLFGTPESSKS